MKRLKRTGLKPIGENQKYVLQQLIERDGWWSKGREFDLHVGYQPTRILDSLVNRGLLSVAGGVYTITIAGRREVQHVTR